MFTFSKLLLANESFISDSLSMEIMEAKITYSKTGLTVTKDDILDQPDKVHGYLAGAFDQFPMQEQMIVILLNRKNAALGRIVVTVGTETSALVNASVVFRPAILAGATAVIIAHNHPSGDPAPSEADIRTTRQLRDAAKCIGIDLLDHVVVGSPENDPKGVGYYSFQSNGLI